jgi:hypothetical protein
MTRRIGYLIMKLSMRQQGDPISRALDGSPSTDPSVAAFVDELRVAAGREESVMASIPMDAIVDAVTSGSNPAYGDLSPVRHATVRRRLVRAFTTAGLATKLLFGAAAVAAVTTTAAVTGSLPGPVQDFVADSVDGVGIHLPHTTELREPVSTVPGDRIEHRNDVRDYNDCVREARATYIAANGNASGFDGVAACGERPDPRDYEGPNAPGLDDNPSDTRPPAPATPADTRPQPPGRPGD